MAHPETSKTGQREVDKALKATFPASDPPAFTTATIDSRTESDRREDQAEVMQVFRVVHRDQADAPFTRDQNQSGGRWTSPGVPAIYASTTAAGAVLEFLAHLDGEQPADLVLVTARMPGRSLIQGSSLPEQWRETPYRDDVREYGNEWARTRQSLAMAVPSVLCEQTKNLLINPDHDDIGQLMIESVHAFTLDPRLLRH